MNIVIRFVAAPILLGITLAGCDTPKPHIAALGPKTTTITVKSGAAPVQVPVPVANTSYVDAFARTVLNALQPRSIAETREYCGYIYALADGTLAATPATRGTEASCDMNFPSRGAIASYHTHGSFSARYDNEVPSTSDLQSDFDFNVDGYVSTPGGRLWRVDHQARIARQVCGAPCVYADPNNDPNDAGHVAQTYTLAQLARR